MEPNHNRYVTELPAPSKLIQAKRRLFLPLVIAAEIVGVGAVVLVGVWLAYYQARPGFHWDTIGKIYIHPFVMTLGMVFIFGNGTLLYRVGGRLSVPRKLVKAAHTISMLLVIACTGLGIYLAITSIIGKKLQSVHAVMGLTTTCLFVLQFLCGFFIFGLPCAREWIRASYMELHAYFGILTLASAAATCLTGMQGGYSMFGGHPAFSLTAALFVVAFTAIITYILTRDAYRPNRRHEIN